MNSGRQAYSRLTDDKRVIYYRELPSGTAAPPALLLPTLLIRSSFPLSLPVPRLFFPATRLTLFSHRRALGALQTTPSSPYHPHVRPASFIRRKIHLHNGPHAHRLLTRSSRIVHIYTLSWKLMGLPTWLFSLVYTHTHVYIIYSFYIHAHAYVCIYWPSQKSSTFPRR